MNRTVKGRWRGGSWVGWAEGTGFVCRRGTDVFRGYEGLSVVTAWGWGWVFSEISEGSVGGFSKASVLELIKGREHSWRKRG